MKTRLTLILFSIGLITNAQKTLTAFMTSIEGKNIEIIKVVPDKNILDVTYFNTDSTAVSEKVKLHKKDVLAIGTWYKTFYTPKISVITVPFKVRRKQDDKPQFVSAGNKNAGLNLGFINYKQERYFSNGTMSTHKVSFGAIVAPSAEELSIDNTDGLLTTKSTQLFISTGLSVTYTYNSISFVLIPIGFDFSTTSDGSAWIYDHKWWWGLGIGIDTKLFGF